MMSVNWAKLAAQNRVKAVGIPWTPEEANAIYNLKIPADYVREGILTLEDYEKAKTSGMEEPKKKEKLEKEAKELGISFTPDVTPEALKEEIAKKKEVMAEENSTLPKKNVRETKAKIKKS